MDSWRKIGVDAKKDHMERDVYLSRVQRFYNLSRWSLLALIGFILGFLSNIVAGVGFWMLFAALLLRYFMWTHRDDREYVEKIRNYGYAIASFGAGAVFGFLLRFLVQVFSLF
jgi:Flp pilus assembly protein TadB